LIVSTTPIVANWLRLDDPSYIQCELIRSINQNRLIHRLGAVDSEIGNQVTTVIRTLLNY